MITCDVCPVRGSCTSLCQDMQNLLDQDSRKNNRANWVEIDCKVSTMEYLLNLKSFVGNHTMLNSVNSIYNDDNIIFIEYLIKNHLPKKQGDILYDYYFNQINQYQMAKKYKVRQPTIFYHIRKGIKTLKEMVEDLIEC